MKCPTKTVVSFTNNNFYTQKTADGCPLGEDVAKAIHTNLVGAGFEVDEILNRDDYAWDMWVRSPLGYRVLLIIGFVGDPDRQWLLTGHLSISLKTKWFSSMKIKQEIKEAVHKIFTNIQQTLIATSSQDIKWFNLQEFDRGIENKWSPEP